MNDTTQQVVRIVAEVVGLPPEGVASDASMDSVPNWDSLAQLTICMEFQERFGIEMDLDAIANATSVAGLVALVPQR